MRLKLGARARQNLNVRRLCSRRATREIPTSRPAIAARLPEGESLNKAGAYHRQRTGNLADRRRPDTCCSTLPLRSTQLSTRRLLCVRSEEHTSELQSPLNISYAVFCLKK